MMERASQTQESIIANKLIESEINRLRDVDGLLISDIEESHLGDLIFIPSIVIYITFILIAKFTNFFSQDNSGELIFYLAINLT